MRSKRMLWVVERKAPSTRGLWVITHGIAETRDEARVLMYNMRSHFPYSELRVVPYIPAPKARRSR